MINDYPHNPDNERDDNDYSDTDEYTNGESSEEEGEEEEDGDAKPPRTSQKRRRTPSKCPVKRKHVKNQQGQGQGLRDDLPKEIVRKRPCPPKGPATSKPKSDKKCSTFSDSTDEEDDEGQRSKETAETLVSRMNTLGNKFCRAKNAQQKMLMVSKISKSDLMLFGVVIRNVWEGKHGAFQLAEEEHRRLRPFKLLFKEYLKVRTTIKRRREIMLEGSILKNLTELMTQLEVE